MRMEAGRREGGSAPAGGHLDVPLFHEAVQPAAPVGKRPIAVIGAGFSGTIAALHLLRRVHADQPILLCERASDFARGVAYATGDHTNLLNVRAANMSALNDERGHFEGWLTARAAAGPVPEGLHDTPAGLFASRGLYGQYLRSILDQAMRQSAGHAQLRLLPDDVLDVTAVAGGGYELTCASGQRLAVAGVVLAVGNLPPEESGDPRICRNPWSEKAWAGLEPDRPVMIVGTGLTMVDIAVGLRRRGFEGGITALSRGGLLPAGHAATPVAWPTPVLTAAEEGSVRLLTARLRREVAQAAAEGVNWRAVIDSLRPITAGLWRNMPQAERSRFLRHARRQWDIHRHRMAPPHARLIAGMIADGTLRVVAGRIVAMESGDRAIRVRYTPRGSRTETSLDVQRVILAAGIDPIARTRDRLMQRLLDGGLIRVDRQGLGLEVTDDLRVVCRDGGAADRIWALGPIVRGVFWECVAVPDIRVRAALVADSVVARLREDAPRWSFAI